MDWCDQCHRKGGLVVGQDFTIRGVQAKEEWLIVEGELLADLILGKIDALDVGPLGLLDNEEVWMDWQAVLNAGIRVPLAGGSAKRANRIFSAARAPTRTFQAGQEFTYKAWIEAVRAGRTFVTNGPLLAFTVNGQAPGAVLDLSASAMSFLSGRKPRSRPLRSPGGTLQ